MLVLKGWEGGGGFKGGRGGEGRGCKEGEGEERRCEEGVGEGYRGGKGRGKGREGEGVSFTLPPSLPLPSRLCGISFKLLFHLTYFFPCELFQIFSFAGAVDRD